MFASRASKRRYGRYTRAHLSWSNRLSALEIKERADGRVSDRSLLLGGDVARDDDATREMPSVHLRRWAKQRGFSQVGRGLAGNGYGGSKFVATKSP